jgi:hypothetical protein
MTDTLLLLLGSALIGVGSWIIYSVVKAKSALLKPVAQELEELGKDL